MNGFKLTNWMSALLLFSLLFVSSVLYAQKIIDSSDLSAGFSFADNDAVTEPVIYYQQNIQMLSGINDRPSLSVFGNGRVLVHYPAYMKKAGDYEMQLDDVELVNLLQSLANNGIIGFDENKVKADLKAYKKALKDKGQFYEISDAEETIIDIKFDEFQKNKTSKKIKGFHKQFKWKNIEHDASRYKHDKDITKANNSVTKLKGLMKDARLVKKDQR